MLFAWVSPHLVSVSIHGKKHLSDAQVPERRIQDKNQNGSPIAAENKPVGTQLFQAKRHIKSACRENSSRGSILLLMLGSNANIHLSKLLMEVGSCSRL